MAFVPDKFSKDTPLVSVVAVCYNQAIFVEETLDSILAQTYPNIELIIIDDASTDNSVTVINNWIKKNNTDCPFIVHEKNLGICKTINEGLKLIKGTYYQGCACDDIMLPHKIDAQLKYLEENPGLYMVCSNYAVIDEKSRLIKNQYFNETYTFPPADKLFDAILNGHMGHWTIVHSPTVLLKPEVFKHVGYYPENILQEDLYMWLKISALLRIGYYPYVTVKYRVHNRSLSKDTKYSHRIHHDSLMLSRSFMDEFPEKEESLLIAQKRTLAYFLYQVNENELPIEKYITYASMYTKPTVFKELMSNGDIDRHLLDLFLSDKKLCLELINQHKIKIRNRLYRELMSANMPVCIPKFLIKLKRRIRKIKTNTLISSIN